jgi:DNA-binding transcriptional MerR regulator
MTDEIAKKYFTIGDVAEMIGEAPSLIRFWEKEFTQLKPNKTEKGTRKYTQKDIELIKYIYYLVKQKGYTLDGAKEALRNEKKASNKAELVTKLTEVRDFLMQLKQQL